MLSRGKILVHMSLKASENKLPSNDSETKETIKFTIKDGKLNETTHNVENTATKLSFENSDDKSMQSTSRQIVEPEDFEQTDTNLLTNDVPLCDIDKETGPEESQMEDECLSDSDITIDYDDEARDPDWKNPDENQTSETDENNNVLFDEVDPGEVYERQNKDGSNQFKRKRKNGKMKEIQKQKRMKGEKYKGVKKNDQGTKTYCIERNGKYLCPANCGKKCQRSKVTKCDVFSDKDRGNIFEKFWKVMSWQEKRCYVLSHIDRVEVKQRTKGPGVMSRRNYSCRYFLRKGSERVEVCQSMFNATLGMNRTIYNWLKDEANEVESEATNIEANKRTSRNSSIPFAHSEQSERKRLNKERENSARQYLNDLPKVESHYCRSRSKKMYLESTFDNKSQLYREYVRKTQSEGQVPFNKAGFLELFDDMNLAIYKPKKDQCDKCVEYDVGNLAIEEYNIHIERKNDARECKHRDKTIALEDNSVKVVTMDLQSLLICPRLEASSIYYKMKLSCHNFTLFDLGTCKANNYFWHEAEGDLNAKVFASCLIDYLDAIPDKSNLKTVIIYSDGCTYQNRNSTMANALLLWTVKNNITVYQKYLERGHTHMECDSVHSVIERKLHKQPIYVPQMYVDKILEAKTKDPKYEVKYVDHKFFNDYESLNYYASIRPGTGRGEATVTDLRVLKYNINGTIEYKLKYSDEFGNIPRPRANRCRAVSAADIPNKLYKNSIPIKKAKYAHLMQLKSVIPSDYHGFYDSLPHVE